MRHRLGYKKLNRTSEHRKALIKNICCKFIIGCAVNVKAVIPPANPAIDAAWMLIFHFKVIRVTNKRRINPANKKDK